MSQVRYLELDELHEIVQAVTGSDNSVRDWGLLASAAERPRTDVFGVEAYPTLHAKAAALLHSLARNHALVDGNKRTAWVAAQVKLYLNGVDVAVPTEEAVPFVEAIARGDIEVDEIAVRLWPGLGRAAAAAGSLARGTRRQTGCGPSSSQHGMTDSEKRTYRHKSR